MTDHSQQGFATRAIHLGYDPLQSRARCRRRST